MPLFRGRLAPYLGIMLVSLGLLTGVTSFSPIAEDIARDIHLTPVTYGALGMLGPFTLGVMGLITPFIARRLTLEWTIVAAAFLMAAGQLLRALAGEAGGFFVFSVVSMLGIGAANMLLPALIKRYFPDRVVSVSTVYVVLLVVSSIYPPLFAVPLAQAFGWRLSVGLWFLIEALAVIPWFVTAIRSRKPQSVSHSDIQSSASITRKVWSHPASWALMAGYAVATFNFYIVVAWLPAILVETAGADQLSAGALLSLYPCVGVVAGFFIPQLVAKFANVGMIFTVNVALIAVGYLGLILAPGTLPWLWVVFAGTGPSLFSIILVAINYRTKTDVGASALSGMVTGGGYILGAIGPLIVGVLRANGAPWSTTLVMLILSLVVTVIAGLGLRRRVNVDD